MTCLLPRDGRGQSCQFQLGARHLGLLPRSVTSQGVRLRGVIGIERHKQRQRARLRCQAKKTCGIWVFPLAGVLAFSRSASSTQLLRVQWHGREAHCESLGFGCDCRRNCMSSFLAANVIGFCKAFHSANEVNRHMCFLALYNAETDFAPPGRASRTQLEVCGNLLRVNAFCSLLGICKRFYKLIHGEPDLRTKESGVAPRFSPQQARVDEFFRDLYQAAAEPLAAGAVTNSENLASWASINMY